MAKEATFRVTRMGTPVVARGLTAPEECDVCHTEPPYVLFENVPREKMAWLCKSCLEKGYPEIHEDLVVMDFFIEGRSIPFWSKGTNRGS